MTNWRTVLTATMNLLFQLLVGYDVVEVGLEDQVAITSGLLAAAQIFQRLATRKAERAARGQIVS